ncbi:ADP-ribosylation factor-like protein 13A isoform X2 [Thalassophryne amazonica]|nr:ADP-ribosylation factor-like protein 13A isoform X2 [Thalassophryne amazonica]
MFNLMSNCCTWVSKIQEPISKVTILVVGLDKAGKTASIRVMLRVPHSRDAGPTQACVRSELRVENYLVTLLDAGGSAESRGSWKDLCAEAHGIIFVVDSTDRQRIQEVREVLADLLKQPRVAGKPLLVLANKQDKMNALVGSELIEILSLEKLVNQSCSLCHIEPCSALMDLRRWSDRKTLRGLRWLLRAVCLDYPELCARVARDSKIPLKPEEREPPGKNWKAEKRCRKTIEERLKSSKSDLHQVHRLNDKDKKPKGDGKLQPIRSMLQKENMLKKKLKSKKHVTVKESEISHEVVNSQEEEEADANEGEQRHQKEKSSCALIPPKKGKLKRKMKVKEETLGVSPSPESEGNPPKGGKKKKKKVIKLKRKNKINTEGMPAGYSQPVDLSATFDLYRTAIRALKERQEQRS